MRFLPITEKSTVFPHGTFFCDSINCLFKPQLFGQLVDLVLEEGALAVGRHMQAGTRGDAERLDGRAVHQAAALELLREQALAVASQPADKLLVRKLVMIRELRQTQGLGWAEAADEHLVSEEVLQAVRADGILALLLDLIVMYRQKLRCYGAVKHIVERGLEDAILGLARDIADVRANLSLGQTHIDVVHAGMVAVIGAPAVDELAEILGTDVKAVELIGDIHEHLRALARLRVLEGDGVIVMRMTDIVKVLVDALADVDNADFRADLLGDDDGVGLGAGGGAEAGHSAGDDVRRGQPQLLDRHRADHDGKRGVHAAGDTDDAVVKSGVLHTLDKAGDLNVEHTLAVRGQIGLVRGQMRVLAVAAGQFGLRNTHRNRGQNRRSRGGY